MEIPESLLQRFQQASDLTTKAVCRATERGELMKEMMEVININRVSQKYKPVTMARMGMLLQNIPTDALYTLVSKCKDAGNRGKNYHESYSKKFYYEIKPHEPNH